MNAVGQLLRERVRDMKPEGPVPSPCLSVCAMDGATGLCRGCFRTLDEIAAWSTLGDTGKRDVWRRIVARIGP